MTPPTISFPKDRDATLDEAYQQVFDLFHDHYPYLQSETERHWCLGRRWPNDPLWYIDPLLVSQAIRIYGLAALDELAQFTQISYVGDIPIVLSMIHSRALIAPALAFTKGIRSFDTIIHVDAHDDLIDVPFGLSAKEPSLLHNVSFGNLDVDQPESVRDAIDTGFVHKGNFLTAYMLAKPAGQLIHVFDHLDTHRLPIEFKTTTRLMAKAEYQSTSLIFSPPCSREKWLLREEPYLPEDLDAAGDNVWLDIDLDAFCNRFDGDSDRRALGISPAERSATLISVEMFLSSLAKSNWLRDVSAVSIALSPGFFPSEYWDEIVPLIYEGVTAAIGSMTS